MSIHVNTDPVILDKLHAFGARRRRLILVRGMCETIACLLAVMSLIALIDWLILLPDTVRYAMSIAGYAVVGVFVWRTCVRLIMHSPNDKQLAVLLESVDERFHEDLLSAIELGETDADFDSPVFRKLLQTDVAGRVKDLQVERVLPGAVVARWAAFAVFAVAVCIGLVLFAPQLNFGQLLARAMFPGANIARVSGVHVTILEPAPNEPTVPQGEPVSIVVELEGPEVKQSWIELRHPDGQREDEKMVREVGRRYATTVGVGRETLEYRVKAGDAVTKWYTITAKPRPYVTAFTKTITLPQYAERDPATTTDTNGDVTALVGSTVELVLETDQKIESASLKFEFGGEERIVPLAPAGEGKLKATVAASKSGLYRVNLVAADTGFTNEFSPQHEWLVIPDTVPNVTLTDPSETLTLPADQILSLRGVAEDDLGLARVEQWIRVNGERPVTVPLVAKPGATYGVDKAWDLLDLKLRAGDTVTTRLVAVDLAGHRAESNALTLSIAAEGVDIESLAAVRREQGLADELARLLVVANAQRANAREAVDELKKSEPGDPAGDLYAVNLTEALSTLVEQTNRADGVAARVLGAARAPADIHDLADVRLALTEVRLRPDHRLGYHLSSTFDPEERERRDASLESVYKAFDNAYDDAAMIYKSFDRILAAHELAAAIEQLHAIVEIQKQVNDPTSLGVATGEARITLLRRRQSVAAAQVEAIERMLAVAAERKDNKQEKQIEGLVKHMSHHREELTKAMDKADNDEELTRASARFAQEIENVYRGLRPIHRELDRDAVKLREYAGKALPRAYADVYRIHNHADELVKHTKRQAERAEKGETDNDEFRKTARELEIVGGEIMRYQLPLTADLLRARSNVVESRPGGDARLAADYGLSLRALTQARDEFIVDADSQKLRDKSVQIEYALRALETIGEVRELAKANTILGLLEQYEADRLAARTRRPRQWDFEHELFQPTAELLGHNKLNEEAKKILHDLRNRPYSVSIRDEFESRRLRDEVTKTTHENLAAVQRDLDEALRLLQEDEANARRSITEIAPTLAQEMRKAAEQAKEAAQESQELAEQDADAQAEPPKQEQMAKLQQEQAALNERTRDVLDALRQEANLKDTLDREQLAQARDADAAAAMIKEPAERADAAVADALDQPPRPDRAEKFAEASEQQQDLSEALELAADHFEKLANGEDVSETRQALRDAEQDLGVRSQLDEQYAVAERLAELTEESPQTALAELEKELQKNRAMQRELDHIAEQVNEQAGEKLADAAKQEQQVGEKLAEAQKQADPKNAELERQLADLGRQAQQLAQNEVAKAEQQSQMAKADDAAKQNEQAAEQLERAADTASPSDAEQAERIADAAEQAAEQLEQATNQIAESAKQAEQAAQAAEQQSPLDQGRQAKAKAAQNQAQQAQAEAQQAQEKAQAAAEKAQQAADSAKQAEQQAANAQQGSPEQQQAQQQAQAALQEAEKAANEIQQAAREAQQAARRTQQAAQMADEATDSDATEAVAENAAQQAEQAQADARAAEQTAQAGDTDSARELTDRAEQASRELTDAAEQLKQAAQAAENAAKQTAADPQTAKEQAQGAESAAQQAQQAAQSAKQAADQAKQAAQSAQQAAKDQPNQGAQQQAEQAAQRAEQASQLAQQASEAAQSAEQSADAAEKTASAAEQGSPEAQQANQQAAQAANQAQQASQLAKQASQQAQQAAAEAQNASQQAAQSAQQQAEQAGQQAQQAQQAADAAQQAQPGSEQAQQAAQQAAEAQANAQKAQQTAQQSKQSAEQAGQQSQQAANTGQQAQQKAEAASQQASAAQQSGAAAQQQAAQQAAQQSQQAAQRAEQLAQQAAQLAGRTQQQAEQQGSPLAEAAEAQAPISEQVGQAGRDIARAARHAERLGDAEMAESLNQVAEGTQQTADQVGEAAAGLAEADSARDASPMVADAREAIEQQANALAEATGQQPAQAGQSQSGQSQSGQSESGQSPSGESPSGESQAGESPSGQSPSGESAQGESQSGESQSGQSQSGQSQSGQSQSGQSQSGQSQSGQAQSGQSQSGQSQSGQAQSGQSPLDNPETGKWLARALDAADQAAFDPVGAGEPGDGSPQDPGQAPGGDSQLADASQGESQSGQSQSGESQSGESQSGQSQSGEGQGQSSQGQSPGQGQSAAMSAAAQAAQAALAQAAAAQAQAMSAARSQSASQSAGQSQQSNQPSNSPLSRSQTLISRGGASAQAGEIDYDKLADAKRLKDEDWGRLPPKLARDLLEAQRDGVSGEYRHMVETYFRTIAERARHDEKQK